MHTADINSSAIKTHLKDLKNKEACIYARIYANKKNTLNNTNLFNVLKEAYPDYKSNNVYFDPAIHLLSNIHLIDATVRVADSVGLLAMINPKGLREVRLKFKCSETARINSVAFGRGSAVCSVLDCVSYYQLSSLGSDYVLKHQRRNFSYSIFEQLAVYSPYDIKEVGLRTYNRERFIAMRNRKQLEAKELLGGSLDLAYLILGA